MCELDMTFEKQQLFVVCTTGPLRQNTRFAHMPSAHTTASPIEHFFFLQGRFTPVAPCHKPS